MYFQVKNILKRNLYYTSKHARSLRMHLFLWHGRAFQKNKLFFLKLLFSSIFLIVLIY